MLSFDDARIAMSTGSNALPDFAWSRRDRSDPLAAIATVEEGGGVGRSRRWRYRVRLDWSSLSVRDVLYRVPFLK